MKRKEFIKWIVCGAVFITALIIGPDMSESILSCATAVFLLGLLLEV